MACVNGLFFPWKCLFYNRTQDIHDFNLVMNHQGQCSKALDVIDAFPRDFGPCGAKYAFIDFGESHLVHTGEVMRLPADLRFHTETAAPELLEEDPVKKDVFCCDVYALGAVLRRHVEHAERLVSAARFPTVWFDAD